MEFQVIITFCRLIRQSEEESFLKWQGSKILYRFHMAIDNATKNRICSTISVFCVHFYFKILVYVHVWLSCLFLWRLDESKKGKKLQLPLSLIVLAQEEFSIYYGTWIHWVGAAWLEVELVQRSCKQYASSVQMVSLCDNIIYWHTAAKACPCQNVSLDWYRERILFSSLHDAESLITAKQQ